MAQSKKTIEDLNKKYGIKGSITPNKTEDRKQSTSASSKNSKSTNNDSKTALDKLNAKYGVTGKNDATPKTFNKKNGSGETIASKTTKDKTTINKASATNKPTDYSSAVKYLSDKGVQGASGIMTENEWRRRNKSGGTYQNYLDSMIGKYSNGGTSQPQTTSVSNNETRLEALKNELSEKKIKYTDEYWQSVHDEAVSRFRSEGQWDAVKIENRAWAAVDELRRAWKKEKEEIEDEIRRLSGVRDATWEDAFVNSFKRGYEQSRFGDESFDKMMGLENEADAINALLQNEEYQFEAEGYLKEAVSGASELIGQMGYLYSKPETYAKVGTATLAGAGTAALAGQAGPQITLPEEVATIPAGALLGFKTGMGVVSAENALRVEAGHAYNEMIESGISHETATKIALAVGTVNASLEVAQVDELIDAFKVLNKSGATSTVAEKIFQELIDRGVDVAKETLQEVTQEGVTMGGAEIAHRMDKGEGLYTLSDVGERLSDTAKSSALAFGMMNVPATITNVATVNNKTDANRGKFVQSEQQTTKEQQITQPDTLEQAAMDVVASRNATQAENIQPVSSVSTTDDSLPTQNGNELKTPKNVRSDTSKGLTLAESLEEQSKANELLSVEDVKKATGFGDAGSKLVTRLANSQGVTFSQAERKVKTAYLAGFTDLKTKDVSFDNALQKAAFDAGKLDIEVQNRAKLADAKNATVYDGAFTENKYTKNWSEATKKMVSTVAKHFGMDISAVDKIIANKYTGAEANAYHSDGKMRISNNRTAEKLIHALVLHESGHRMEQFATAEWNELANFLYQRAERLGRRVELGVAQGMRFDAVKAEHDNAGISMSTSGYIGEIAVQELETIFSSAEEFNSFVTEIESNQQVKSAWGKFVEWLSELIEDLKTAWSQRKMTAEEKAEARKTLAELEHIKELYAKAYLATKDAVQERANTQISETNSSKNLEIKTNKEYNGNKSYSLQDSADAKLATIKRLILAIRGRRGLKYDGGRVIRIPDNDMATLRHKFMTEHHYSNRSGGNIDCIDCFGQGGKKHYFYVFHVGEDNRVAPIFRLDYEYIERYLDDVQKISKEMGYNKDEFINTASGNGKGIDRIRNLAKGDSVYDVSATGRETNHRSGEVYNSESGRGSTDNGHSSSGISNGYDKQSNYGSLSEGKKQFSLKQTAPTFYSHMGKTIDEMKQDKIGANSVVSYLTGRGVKAEEIKWSGIETFLEGKKSVSKAELQEFVAGNQLQIETETRLSDYTIDYTEDESKSLDEISKVTNEIWQNIDDLWRDKYGEEISWDIRYNDNAVNAMYRQINKLQKSDNESGSFFNDIIRSLNRIEVLERNQNTIVERAKARTLGEKANTKTKWDEYTLDGGSNYRELLFKLPNSAYTNESMRTHWDNTEGVLAHARIQDFDVDGKKMLFIEEIQSDWHNEGQKKGYGDKGQAKQREKLEELRDKNKAERANLIEELSKHYEGKVAIPEEAAKTLLSNIANDKSSFNSLIKRDGISDTLAERIVNYELAKVEEAIQFQKSLKKGVEDAPFRNNYHEYVLKNLIRMAAEDGYDSLGWTTAEIQSQRWSDEYAEGYRIEYDQDIPKFLNKYGKKWGAKVGTSNVNGNEVWSMPITDSMKDSVLYEGQPQFSLKQPVEETKNLIAVHNMQSSELERTLDLGGLPMPSIAIIKAQSGHSEYGDVSLVFDKQTIDPKSNKNNKVYGGDAWTPTYPTIEYKPNEKLAKKISDKYYEFSRKFGYDESRPLYNYVNDLERQLNNNKGEAGMLEELYNDTRVMQFYLLDSGKGKVETINKETRTELTDAEVKMHEFFIKELGADVVDEVKWDGKSNPRDYSKNYMSKYEGAIREAYKKLLSQEYQFTEEEVQNVLDSTKPFKYLSFVRDAQKYRENGRVTIKTEADYEATQKAIKDAAGEDYRKWVDSLFKGIEEKSGIRNNLSYYTNSGNQRSWEALHWENNLENVVKVMKSEADVGSGTFFAAHSIWGVSAKNYGSIEEMKADTDRLKQLPEEEYNQIKEGFGERLTEIAHSIMSKTERNPFIASDNAMECIVEAVRNSKTKSGILSRLKQYPQLTVTQTTVDDIVSLVNDISNMPTEYFEAKPKRAVELNEIATAIIPNSTSETTKARLDDMGIKYLEYEAGNEEARLEALNSLEDLRFSLKGTNSISTKDRAELLDIIEHLKGEFEITKFAKADPKKLAKMTKDLLKEYNSQADFNETYKAIDELYQYMANGEEGQPAVWEDVYNRAYNVAREIVKNAIVTDDYAYREYKSLRDYLRTTPMKFNAGYDSVPSSYENFNDFRKHNMGRLKFTNNGMGIDEVYQELSGLYPEFFDAEEQTNSSAQLERMVDVLDELQPTDVNPFDRQIEQVSMYLANDITSRFFDIPQAKPTFADKAERRVVEANIKGGKRVEAVRQQKDAKIKKLMETQREKTKKQLDKLRQQRDNKVKKEQEKRRAAISKMSESQKAKVLRAQIMRHTSELSKKLVNPTDNQHIPQELQGVVAKLLECINLESNYTYDAESDSYKKNDKGLPTRRTQAFNELKQVYADIASSVVVDPDLIVEGGLLSDVISLADKRIADMNSSELQTVWQAIRAIEASVSTANKIFSQGKFETILEFAEALREDNAGKKEKTELKSVFGKGKKLVALDMLTPETYLHYLGGAGDSIFRMMRDAQDKHISIMKEVADFTHKALKDVNVNSLEKTIHTVKLGGEDVKLSTAQLMELYVLMKREQAVDHILVGGILPDAVQTKGIKDITRAEPVRNVSIDEISKAISKLTDEQKKVADKLQRYVSSVLSAYGNEASMKVYNYEKFLEKNYWTIRTNKQEIVSEIGKDTAVTSVANKGMAKGTKPHANTSVRIGSIFDTFSAHSSDMATYAAWLGTSEDVNRIRNFVFKENGVRTGTVKGILDTVHGIHGSEYFQKLLTDIAIGVKGTDNMNPFDKLIGNYKAASVGANLRVVIQQPTAILRAMDMIGAHYLAEGVVRPLKGWEKAKKYAPIAQWKDWGYFDINTGRQMKDVLFDNASLLEKTKQVGMWGASKADSFSWGQLWNAVEAETKSKHKELEVGSEAYYETVAKRFTEIVDHTQVVDGILQRSQIMRSPDALTKMATSFMGEPTKQYNMAASAAYDAINSKGNAKKKAVNRLGRTAVSLAVAGIVNACAQSFIDAIRDDDKEKDYWEKWLTAFIGDGEDTKWYNSNLADSFNPLSYIPFAKDILSIMQGYDIKRMDAEAITKTFNAAKNMYKAVTGTGKYTIAEASAQLFAEVGRLFGLPVANVKRDIKSLVMSAAIESDSYLMQYRMEKAMLDINYAGNSKNFMDILFNAYNNDREAYELIYNDMLESGYDADKIESGMETRMKEAEGVKKVSELSKRYMSPDDEKKYDSSLSRVKSSKVWTSANTTQRKNAEADLYEFLTSTTDDMTKLRTEARAFGVDETEYTLWQLAIEMADQPKGQKGSGSYDYKEKAEAINSLNLGDKEIAYFFGKGLTESGKEELNEVMSEGIDVKKYVNFKAAVSEMKSDKNAKGNSIPNSKKRKVVNYLNDANLTYDEWSYFYYEIMNYKK